MDMVSKMGPLGKVAQMLPGGLGQMLQGRDMEGTQQKMAHYRVILDSMTAEERAEPGLLKAPRIGRIARGSGRTTNEVRELLKYYEATKGMMKGMGSNRKMMARMARQMGKGG
jgi:signal recognition particle subunit SRP54